MTALSRLKTHNPQELQDVWNRALKVLKAMRNVIALDPDVDRRNKIVADCDDAIQKVSRKLPA